MRFEIITRMSTIDSTNPISATADGKISTCLSQSTEINSQSGKIEVELEWDFLQGTPKVDLDASCIMFDVTGSLTDAVYYNQLSVLDAAVTHSGDIKATANGSVKEIIHVDLDRIPNVNVLVFVLSAYEGGTLTDCESASANFKQNSNLLCSIVAGGPETGKRTSLILGTHLTQLQQLLYILVVHVSKSCVIRDAVSPP